MVALLGLFLLFLSILLIDTKYFDFLYKISVFLTVGAAIIMALAVVYQLLSMTVRIGG